MCNIYVCVLYVYTYVLCVKCMYICIGMFSIHSLYVCVAYMCGVCVYVYMYEMHAYV